MMPMCLKKKYESTVNYYANYVPMCLKKIQVNRKNYVIYVPMCF